MTSLNLPTDFSFSKIHTYCRCPQRYFWTYVAGPEGRGYERKSHKLAVWRGTQGHRLLQAYYLGGSDRAAVEEEYELIESEIENDPVLFDDEVADDLEELAAIARIVRRYLDHYAEEEGRWVQRFVEEEFTVQIGKIRLSFTPDVVFEDTWSGDFWINDHKFVASIPDKPPFGDLQHRFYVAGTSVALEVPVVGFMFNYLCTSEPTMPELTVKGDRVKNLARIATDYDTLRAFLVDNAPELLEDDDHKMRLAELKDDGDRWFHREAVFVSDEQIAAVTEDLHHTVRLMRNSHRYGRWPRFMQAGFDYHSCDSCFMKPLCEASMYGWDVERVIAERYQVRGDRHDYEEA